MCGFIQHVTLGASVEILPGEPFCHFFIGPMDKRMRVFFEYSFFLGGLSSPLVATTETHTHNLCVGNSCGVTQPIIVMSRCPTEHPGEDHTR